MNGKKSENFFKKVWGVKQTVFKKQADKIGPKLMKDFEKSIEKGEWIEQKCGP